MFYGSKVLKKSQSYKAKIAASEDFALAETFFALAESRYTPKIAHSRIFYINSRILDIGNPDEFDIANRQRNGHKKRRESSFDVSAGYMV